VKKNVAVLKEKNICENLSMHATFLQSRVFQMYSGFFVALETQDTKS
jgi:hypothetical protein